MKELSTELLVAALKAYEFEVDTTKLCADIIKLYSQIQEAKTKAAGPQTSVGNLIIKQKLA